MVMEPPLAGSLLAGDLSDLQVADLEEAILVAEVVVSGHLHEVAAGLGETEAEGEGESEDAEARPEELRLLEAMLFAAAEASGMSPTTSGHLTASSSFSPDSNRFRRSGSFP